MEGILFLQQSSNQPKIQESLSSNPLVSVIITNFKGISWLKPCLESVIQNRYDNYEIIIIDVKTSEAELATIRNEFPSVCILHYEENPGVAEQHNIGAKTSSKTAKYFLFMDNDAEMGSEALSQIVDFMERNPQCGCAQGEINDAGYPFIFRCLGK